jgi:hypothetical protein
MQDSFAKRLLDSLETVKIRSLVIVAFGSILFFAAVYLVASYYDSGLQGEEHIGFWDCIYFSVVTFTSLGYGDLRPCGFGRLVACVEVIFGLGLFGVGVAKLATHKQSYLLNQLYARELQRRLDLFAESLQEQRRRCTELVRSADRSTLPVEGAMRLLEKVKTEVMKIRAVVSFESRNGYLLSGIPIGSITGLLQALSRLIPALVAVALARRSRRSQKHRSAVRQIIIRIKDVGGHFAGSTSESVSSEVRTLEEKSTDAISQVDNTTRDVDLELKRADEEQRRHLGILPKRAEDPMEGKEGGT